MCRVIKATRDTVTIRIRRFHVVAGRSDDMATVMVIVIDGDRMLSGITAKSDNPIHAVAGWLCSEALKQAAEINPEIDIASADCDPCDLLQEEVAKNWDGAREECIELWRRCRQAKDNAACLEFFEKSARREC